MHLPTTTTAKTFANEHERRTFFDAQMRASNAIEGLNASSEEDALFASINAPGVTDEEAAAQFETYCRNLQKPPTNPAE